MGEDIIKAPVHQLSRTVQQTAANLDYFLCQLAPNEKKNNLHSRWRKCAALIQQRGQQVELCGYIYTLAKMSSLH